MAAGKFEWTEEYSVGVKILDQDHQELFRVVERLQEAIEEGEDSNNLSQIVNSLIHRLCNVLFMSSIDA